MSSASAEPKTRSVAPLIAGLTILAVAAMAASVPDAPIDYAGKGGYMIGLGGFSDQLAKQVGEDGYGYLVVDLTEADASEEALWREYMKLSNRRNGPVWGWIAVRGAEDLKRAQHLAQTLSLKGLFLYSKDSITDARRVAKPGLDVVPVLRTAGPRGTRWAQIVDHDTLVSDARPDLGILVEDELSAEQIAQARAAADDFVISSVAILPFK